MPVDMTKRRVARRITFLFDDCTMELEGAEAEKWQNTASIAMLQFLGLHGSDGWHPDWKVTVVNGWTIHEGKPVARFPKKPALFWNEVCEYIEQKYNVKLRRYKPEVGPQEGERANGFTDGGARALIHRDFWHHIFDVHPTVGNGSYFTLSPDNGLARCKRPQDWWVREIYQMLKDEFGGGELLFWLEW